jgi:DNA-directed RNA polymerase specialized sigma24 family protein
MTKTITNLLREFQKGNDEAALDLLNAFLPKMRKFLFTRARKLRVHDEDDIANNAFFKFCNAIKNSRLQDISDRSELWNVLCRIAIREANDMRKYENSQARGGGIACISIENVQVPLPSLHASPDVQVDLLERGQQLLSNLQDSRLQAIAELKLAGFSNQEIACELNVSKRTVAYLTAVIKERIHVQLNRNAA